MSNSYFTALTPNIMVKDVNKSVDFYTNHLGFKLELSVPKEGKFLWALVKRDKVTLMFHDEKSFSEEYPQVSSKVGGSLIFYIQLEKIESLYRKVQHKVKIIKPINQTPYGMQEFSIQDNSGFILTFAEKVTQ